MKFVRRKVKIELNHGTTFFAVVLGLAFAVFASYNTKTIDVNFIDYVLPGVPVYLVVLTPLLFGIFISFIIHMIKNLWSDLTVDEYKSEVKKLKQELGEITKEAHKLELENTKLKAKIGEFDEDSL